MLDENVVKAISIPQFGVPARMPKVRGNSHSCH